MKIANSTAFSPNFTTAANYSNEKKLDQYQPQKVSFLDKFETDIKNSADLNDTVQVPRTIFKGYLSFMAGTALATIASMAGEKHPKCSNFLNIISTALIIFGTFSFVRPYLITDAPESKKS